MAEPVLFASAAEWRAWLAKHHDRETECVVTMIKAASGEANMTWSESVDQALCFGWIDAVRRRIDDRSYSIRFTRRKAGSIWSAINVKKIEALREAGLMTEAGERAFALRAEGKTGIYSYEREAGTLSDEQRAAFEATPGAWDFFAAQAPWYRRTATHWVLAAKRDETRQRRLAQLIADSAAGRRLGHLSGTARE